jgi:hypothetical protein
VYSRRHATWFLSVHTIRIKIFKKN